MTTNMPNGVVRYNQDDGVATITLNRPESLNSMSDELMQDLSKRARSSTERRDGPGRSHHGRRQRLFVRRPRSE